VRAILTKEELEKNFPVAERLKLEKIKAQSNPVYWINEYISSNVSGATDVQSLVEYSKSITVQLESIYGQIESIINEFGVSDLESLKSYIDSLKDQVENLYSEKEEAINSVEGVKDFTDLIRIAKTGQGR
jgi:archaellum component FlaC